MEKANTIGKMMEDWLTINGINRAEARSRFGFGFDKWILDQAVPKADRIPEISDKTGYSVNELNEGIRLTKEHLLQVKQGKEQVRKFNLKYHPELIKKNEQKPVDDDMKTEADAVRKLRQALADIPKESLVDIDTIPKSVNFTETKKDENFDILLESYAKTYNEKERLLQRIEEIKERIIELDNQLGTIKNSLRRTA